MKFVKFFKDDVSTNLCEVQEVTIGSKFIFSFQVTENFVQQGDYHEMIQYLEAFETEDKFKERDYRLYRRKRTLEYNQKTNQILFGLFFS